jgi:erythronate-4-phosphate dehydrogenase
MKIVADENIPLVNEFFQDFGEVVCLPGRQMTHGDIKDANALLVRSVTKVNRDLVADSLIEFVGTCTIGVDHLDQGFLAARDIVYSSAPGCNANSVVEYVYAALCHLNVNWLECKVGIVGCGNVGGLLHRRLRAQGVDCYCYDPFLTTEQNPDLTSLEQVLACDIISLHTPLTTGGPHPSFHLISTAQLQQLKSGAVLLNCGRGPVIDNLALLNVLKTRSDLRVVLDVWEPEPEILLPLLDRVVLGTPHIAGYSYDGKLKGTEMVYQALCRHLAVDPRKSVTQMVKPLADNQLPLNTTEYWNAAKQLIAQVYDIAADDRRLRDLSVEAMAGQANFAQGFDKLRKYYPIRREFHNYQVIDAYPSPQRQAGLATLGFQFS